MGNAVQTSQPTQQAPNFASFERGRRRKRKKVIPSKRFNYLFARVQQFQNNNLESNHKKMRNKTRKFKTMMLKNLGTMRNRQPRVCRLKSRKNISDNRIKKKEVQKLSRIDSRKRPVSKLQEQRNVKQPSTGDHSNVCPISMIYLATILLKDENVKQILLTTKTTISGI